jgi:hypothetical protein
LTRPWCLIELYKAIENNIPIIGVTIRGQNSYDFAAASNFLLHLDSSLEDANPGAAELLRANGVDVLDCAFKLHSRIPQIISIEYNSSASRNILHATMDDIAENVQNSLSLSPRSQHPLPSREEFDALRVSAPYARSPTTLPSPSSSALKQHGAAAEPPRPQAVKMAAGSAILQLAKSPVPGLAPVAFMLQAVTVATERARHLRDEADMFGVTCQSLEQQLVERGDDLRLHPDRAGIIASIVELLKAGLTELKPLAREDFDPSSADMSTFAMLCGDVSMIGARLGTTDAATSHAASAADGAPTPSAEELNAMKRKLEEQQTVRCEEAEKKRILELQNQVLTDRVREMTAVLDVHDVNASAFLRCFPLPAAEADRLLVIDKYKLANIQTEQQTIEKVEGILKTLCSNDAVFGPDLRIISTNIQTDATQQTVSYYFRGAKGDDDSSWTSLSEIRARVGATPTSKEYWKGHLPRKLTGCQYVVASGEMMCGVRSCRAVLNLFSPLM